jgi:cell fate (sporulation/competence/biofilm development) regulator YlbF (YheA/YmcA/DUF963 family)
MSLDPHSKLARVRKAMAECDWNSAIKLAAQFQNLGKQAADIQRANDAINNPELYQQLRRDINEIRRRGIAALQERFSKSWQSVQGSVRSPVRENKGKGD